MERCTLKFTLQNYDEADDALHRDGRSAAVTHTFRVQVYRVHAPRPLDTRRLTYAGRPKRETLFGEWELHGDVLFESHEFACSSGTFQTFELVCGDSTECQLDFIQTPTAENGKPYHHFISYRKTRSGNIAGVWLVQRSSI